MKKLTFLKTMLLAVVLMTGNVAWGQTYTEDFETLSQNSYVSATVTLNGFDWNFTGAVVGNLDNDWKIGSRSVRLAGSTKNNPNEEPSKIEMLANKPGGIGNITFQYRRYGSDEQISWKVEWSADGTTWTTIESITGTDEVQTFSYDLNQDNARIRIIADGYANLNKNTKRLNVDNLILTDNGGTPTPTISATPSTLDFGEVNIGETVEKEITVTGSNLTAAPTHTVSGTGFTVAGELTAEGGTLTVTYAPTAEGASTGTLTITGDEQTATVALSGTGVTPIAPGEIPDVIISEVYGGGGNSGAPLSHDFVELFNTTGAEIDISGWSIQYYSASGTTPSTTNVFVLPEGSKIPANGHFLIQCAAGSNEAGALPTPDAVAESGMTMGAKSGKVALFSTGDAQDINDISSLLDNPNFKDYVPYGSATPVWGTALGVLTNATSATRKLTNGSYEYTADVGADFEVVKPNPQNSSNVLTGLSKATLTDATAWTANGKVMLNATAGEVIEVYNVAGQKVVSRLATDGLNEVAVQLRGVAIVKIGNRISKVVL